MRTCVISKAELNIVSIMAQKFLDKKGSIPRDDELYDIFIELRKKLHYIMEEMSVYFGNYCNFKYTEGDGNPVPSNAHKIGQVWAAFYVGENKRVSPQIYAHYNIQNQPNPTIDIGFSFGFDKKSEILKKIGKDLATYLTINKSVFQSLEEAGFTAYKGDWNQTNQISFDNWLKEININPATCRIVKSFQCDVSREEIKKTISKVIFFFNVIKNDKLIESPQLNKIKTKEERMAEYERNLDIGEKGEEWVFEQEKAKLAKNGKKKTKYPIWESKNSDNAGYDICSLNKEGEEIYIEVKTTSYPKTDPRSKTFQMSKNEYDTMQNCKEHYYIYRVYDIDVKKSCDVFKASNLEFTPSNYEVTIKTKPTLSLTQGSVKLEIENQEKPQKKINQFS